MDSTEICILKQTNQVSLCSFLKCKNGMALEPQVRLNRNTNNQNALEPTYEIQMRN